MSDIYHVSVCPGQNICKWTVHKGRGFGERPIYGAPTRDEVVTLITTNLAYQGTLYVHDPSCYVVDKFDFNM